MVVQNSYSIDHGEAYAGMTADVQLANYVTGLNTDSVVIPYGKGVVSDGTEQGMILPVPASTAALFRGVVKRELNRVTPDGATFGVPVERDGSIQTTGAIWVLAAEDGIAKDDPVFLRVGATNPGDFANDVGTGATLSVAIPGAKFLTGGDEGELVKISLVVGG